MSKSLGHILLLEVMASSVRMRTPNISKGRRMSFVLFRDYIREKLPQVKMFMVPVAEKPFLMPRVAFASYCVDWAVTLDGAKAIKDHLD